MTLFPGLFVTLEGGEGTGKSSLAERLADTLGPATGRTVVLTREPGSGPVGARIRSLILDPPEPMDARTEALLMAADRAQHVTRVVAPALRRGDIVISDRHADSSVAYQGAARGLGESEVKAVSLFASAGLTPDFTILLDCPPEVGLSRRMTQGDINRLDMEHLQFHRDVRQSFLRAAAAEPERFVLVDVSTANPDEVFAWAWAALRERLGL